MFINRNQATTTTKMQINVCNERATCVYAILAHVAAVTASDGNKMKARLTCVSVRLLQQLPASKLRKMMRRLQEMWYNNRSKLLLPLSRLTANWMRWCSTRSIHRDGVSRFLTALGSYKKTQFCGIGDGRVSYLKANKTSTRPGCSTKKCPFQNIVFIESQVIKTRKEYVDVQILAKISTMRNLQSNNKRKRIILRASR